MSDVAISNKRDKIISMFIHVKAKNLPAEELLIEVIVGKLRIFFAKGRLRTICKSNSIFSVSTFSYG